MLIRTTAYKFLTRDEVTDAAVKGDLAALTKFVEYMQIKPGITREEYERDKEQLRRLPADSANFGRGIENEYDYDEVKINGSLWNSIYVTAAKYNHVKILIFLYRSSCILLNEMSGITLDGLIMDVSKMGCIDSLIHLFAEVAALNLKIDGFRKIDIDSFTHHAVMGDRLENLKYLIKEFNINFNDNRILYSRLIRFASLSNHNLKIIAFLAEDCNVDKPYVLECLTKKLKAYPRCQKREVFAY